MIQCFDDDDDAGKQYLCRHSLRSRAVVTGKAAAARASPHFLAGQIIHRAHVLCPMGKPSLWDDAEYSSSCVA